MIVILKVSRRMGDFSFMIMERRGVTAVVARGPSWWGDASGWRREQVAGEDGRYVREIFAEP
ncbi:hypothetical protein ABN034_29390 [Actinopolymorpha sp. B11F2]|uniref:hypothetical protein n=1 Tax=Actinopolymorpha sp. B11F2 TaxID=3160862 RepID=UPI0032E3692A